MSEYLDEEKIVESVLEDFKVRQIERKNFENSWQLNINFFLGNQYSYISPSGEIMEYGKQYFWQEREVYNHIANLIEIRLSKLSRVRPSLNVIPFSDDENDIACAKTSRKILKSVSHTININKILTQGTMWSEICGTVFYKVDWNNNAGKVIGKDTNNQLLREGEVEVQVVSPFEIYPDSNTYNSVDECMSIIYARSFHKDIVKNNWGVDVEGQDIDVFTLDSVSTSGGLGYSTISNSMAKKLKKDQVLVIEKYEKPTLEYPNGRLIIVAGNKLIYMGELPYINSVEGKRGFPFIKQSCIPTPNCFWGTSIIERCIPIQRSFNAIKNRKHEFLNRLTMGILSVEDGSLDLENLEEEGLSPGKVLIHRQGASAPTLLPTGSVPIDFQNEENSLINEFINVSGVSDLATSDYLAGGNISGVALQLFIEQDEVKMLTTVEEIKGCVKNIAKQILRLYKQFVITSHVSRIVGPNGKIELFHWKGSDVNSEEIVFDVDGDLNESPAQKRSMIFELLKSGLLHDENGQMSSYTKNKILEQLGFGVWENGRDLNTLHKNSAIKENNELLHNSQIKSPYEIDDHEIHISEHIAFMLGGEFEKYKNDEMEKLILDHINNHKKMINKSNITSGE
jgi:hypothetical protein